METLFNGYTLEIAPGTFPLSTDSIALADFVRLPRYKQILDLGSGCGTLGLLLCAKDPDCHVTGIELHTLSHEAAEDNIRRNKLDSRMKSICADLRQIPSFLEPGSYSVCVSNPPYFSGGPASQKNPNARRDDCCTSEDLFRSAAWALRYGGDFYLVHRPEKLAELCVCGSRHNLELKRLRLLHHKSSGDVSLILMQFRKGGKRGHTWEKIYLYEEDGTPSQAYRRLYHI